MIEEGLDLKDVGLHNILGSEGQSNYQARNLWYGLVHYLSHYKVM